MRQENLMQSNGNNNILLLTQQQPNLTDIHTRLILQFQYNTDHFPHLLLKREDQPINKPHGHEFTFLCQWAMTA